MFMRFPNAFQLLGAWLQVLTNEPRLRTKSIQRLISGETSGLRWSGGSFLRSRNLVAEAYRLEMTPAAEQFVRLAAELMSTDWGLPDEQEALRQVIEQWMFHWNAVLTHDAGFEKFRHRAVKHQRRERAVNWRWRTIWDPDLVGPMVIDFGIRTGALAVLRSGGRLPAWLTRSGRQRFPRNGENHEVSEFLSNPDFDLAPSTVARLIRGERPRASTLTKFGPDVRLHFAAVAAIEVLERTIPEAKVDSILKTLMAVAKVATDHLDSPSVAARFVCSPPPVWSTESVERLLSALAGSRIALVSRSATEQLRTLRQPWRGVEFVGLNFQKDAARERLSFKPSHSWMLELLERIGMTQAYIWKQTVLPDAG